MLWYILKLAILLPLIGGLAWVSLRFAKRMQDRALAGGQRQGGAGDRDDDALAQPPAGGDRLS
ncbi:hypothetical protein ACFSTD_05410 [Novosphingobium colocasiae]